MKRLPLLALVVLLAACSPTPTPTPEPTATTEPTLAPVPTSTPAPTLTVAPTASPEPTVTAEPTTAPTPVATTGGAAGAGAAVAVVAPRGARPLRVEFTNTHYECWQTCLYYDDTPQWGYRSFQSLMVVENVSADRTLEGGRSDDGEQAWEPSRWIITDGAKDWTDTRNWEWRRSEGEFYEVPPVAPGGRAEFTFLAFPIPYGAWVKAVEYVDPWGNLYRQDFAKPEPGQFNYVDCGEPREGGC